MVLYQVEISSFTWLFSTLEDAKASAELTFRASKAYEGIEGEFYWGKSSYADTTVHYYTLKEWEEEDEPALIHIYERPLYDSTQMLKVPAYVIDEDER